MNNSIEVMSTAQGIVPDTEGFDYNDQEKETEAADMAQLDEGMECGSGSETSDSSSDHPNFPCPFCNKILVEKAEVFQHNQLTALRSRAVR